LASSTSFRETEGKATIQRYGTVIGLLPEKVEEYKRLHADLWPDVVKMIRQCKIRNDSI
jgi:L-rhamnose mutarotase